MGNNSPLSGLMCDCDVRETSESQQVLVIGESGGGGEGQRELSPRAQVEEMTLIKRSACPSKT